MKNKEMLKVIMDEMHENVSSLRNDFAALVTSIINGDDTAVGFKIVSISEDIMKLHDQFNEAEDDIQELN